MIEVKGLVKFAPGFGNIEVREVEEPKITSNQVLIEVNAAGICGSDCLHYKGLTKFVKPIVLGHEFSGQIVDIGENVEKWQIGQRIISETSAHICGTCYYCRTGDYYLCPERQGLGSRVDGAFTKYIAVPQRLLHTIPDELSYDEAAVVQPCADIVHAVVRNSNVLPGDTVVVLGPGPMGLLTTQVAKARGASRVIQTGHQGVRLKLAEEIGADVTIPVEKEDPVQIVSELTNGRGADVVFECSGAPSAVAQAYDIVRKQGQITIIGLVFEPVELDFRKIVGKSLIFRGSVMSNWSDYEQAIDLMSREKVRVKPLITHKFPITQWKPAFDAILVEKKAGKVLFTPV